MLKISIFSDNLSKSKFINHTIFCLVLFSLLYWYGALTKPLHIDEFYSWVYSERTSFNEILKLKDFGIGHPPLYHLVQKAIQSIAPSSDIVYIRLANFIFGLLFIFLFVRTIKVKFPDKIFMVYGITCSAAILDLFIFARMWGLLCLTSLILYLACEKYLTIQNLKTTVLLLLSIILGFFADYNFILLMPVVFLTFNRKKSFKVNIIIMSSLFISFWLLLYYRFTIVKNNDWFFIIYPTIKNIPRYFHELSITVLNFWHEEILIVSFLVFIVYLFVHQARNTTKLNSAFWVIPSFILVQIFLNILLEYETIPTGFSSLISIIFIITLIYYFYNNRSTINIDSQSIRIILLLVFSFIILICLSPYFWRNLVNSRFITLLLPWIFILLLNNISGKPVKIISLILIFSGILFIKSNGIAQSIPPSDIKITSNTIFKNAASVSSYYLFYQDNSQLMPYVIQPGSFDKSCKICDFGEYNIPFNKFDEFQLIAKIKDNPANYVPEGYFLYKKTEIGLSDFDNFFNTIFTPVYKNRFASYHFKRNR